MVNRVNVVTSISQQHEVFWTNHSTASLVVKFQDRLEQVHSFFERCKSTLAMICQTMFPLNAQPPTLLALLNKFKDAAEVRILVRNQLVAGAEVAFAMLQARYPTLDLMRVADGPPLGEDGMPVSLAPYYPLARAPAEVVINKLEASTAATLAAQAVQNT